MSTDTPESTTNHASQQEVSPNNPCPFLRALVAQDFIPNETASLEQIVDAIHDLQKGQDPNEDNEIVPVKGAAIKAIGATANGLNPKQVFHNVSQGSVELDELRHGPFDKEGAGTRILNEQGQFVPEQLERLATFASQKTDKEGNTELGLNLEEIQAMIKANIERAHSKPHGIDHAFSEGEFPILLKVLGKQGKDERYLPVSDVEKLFKDRQFPDRIMQRINRPQK